MGETLKIGDEIEVTVLGVKGNQVRLGIEARRMCPFTGRKFTSESGWRRPDRLNQHPAPAGLVFTPSRYSNSPALVYTIRIEQSRDPHSVGPGAMRTIRTGSGERGEVGRFSPEKIDAGLK